MFEMFKGAKIVEIHGFREGSGLVTIVTDKLSVQFFHYQDCCETVRVAQVDGDIEDVIGKTIRLFEERAVYGESAWGLHCATFYALRTDGGDITWRWDGDSNGYYSVAVDHRFRGDADWAEP